MAKINIKEIKTFTKDKDGKPLVSKTGRPYTRMTITDDEGKKYSGFANAQTSQWKVGDIVEVEVTENNGYLNFGPAKASPTGLSIEDRDRLIRIEIGLQRILDMLGNKKEDGFDDIEVDLPF